MGRLHTQCWRSQGAVLLVIVGFPQMDALTLLVGIAF